MFPLEPWDDEDPDEEGMAYNHYMIEREKKLGVSCKNRNRICEKHGLPCASCSDYAQIRRVWNKESIMRHFGISEEEWNYRDTPYPPG